MNIDLRMRLRQRDNYEKYQFLFIYEIFIMKIMKLWS